MNLEQINHYMELERKNCPWVKKQNALKIMNEIKSELKELEHELAINDREKIADELSDVFSDTLLLMHIAKRDGLINNFQDIVDRAYDKKVRRKGWILEGKSLSEEEARKIWYENKAKEK